MINEKLIYDCLSFKVENNKYVTYGYGENENGSSTTYKLGEIFCGEVLTEFANIDIELFKDSFMESMSSYYVNELNYQTDPKSITFDFSYILSKYMLAILLNYLSKPTATLLCAECLNILQNLHETRVDENPGQMTMAELVQNWFNEIDISKPNLFHSFLFLDECIKKIESYKILADSFIKSNNKAETLKGLSQDIRIQFSADDQAGMCTLYSIHDIDSFIAIDISFIIKNNLPINKCENCGKFFIPQVRSDEIYCDNINKNGKTCKQIGYENKLKKDVFKTAYRRAYKTQRARIKYNSHIQGYEELHFKPWEIATKKALKEYTANNDIDGFEKWLKDNRDSF